MNNPYMELLSQLPDPADDWRELAACREVDPEVFYTDAAGEAENRRKIILAKAICRTCPVAVQCLDYAKSTRQRHGVWGGRNMDGRAQQATKTHCKNGHEFTPENTTIATNGSGYEFRRCNACYKAKTERSAAARRERAQVSA